MGVGGRGVPLEWFQGTALLQSKIMSEHQSLQFLWSEVSYRSLRSRLVEETELVNFQNFLISRKLNWSKNRLFEF